MWNDASEIPAFLSCGADLHLKERTSFPVLWLHYIH